jgi:hypothetical protein
MLTPHPTPPHPTHPTPPHPTPPHLAAALTATPPPLPSPPPKTSVGEVFPLAVRSQAIAVAAVLNYGSNFGVSLALPSVEAAVGLPATYLGFAAVGAVALLSIYYTVPETKGKTLEEIEVCVLWGGGCLGVGGGRGGPAVDLLHGSGGQGQDPRGDRGGPLGPRECGRLPSGLSARGSGVSPRSGPTRAFPAPPLPHV